MSSTNHLFKLILICLILATALPAAADPGYELVAAKMSEMRFDSLLNTVQHMVDYGTRFVGSQNAPLVRDFLYNRLVEYGWSVTIQEFELDDPVYVPIGDVDRSWNIIAHKDGYDPDALIILGAHWDSIDDLGTPNPYDGSYANPETPAPGANDNGTGVATLLEIARVLADEPFRQDIEIVFFGSEEWGIQGSKYYLEQLTAQDINIGGFFNVDSIGYDDEWPDDLAIYFDTNSEWLNNKALAWGLEYQVEMGGLVMEGYFQEGYPASANSDVHYFWQTWRPAVSIWEGNDHAPEYNNAFDTIQNCIDYLFLMQSFRYPMVLICEWGDLYDPTPVLLSFFDLNPLPGAVELTWAAGDGFGDEFRLEASQGDNHWQPPYSQESPGHYRAYDDSPHLAAGGQVEYKLYGREIGEEWLLLRQESVRVDQMTPATTPRMALWPNPANPNFRVRLQVPQAGLASVDVYDLSGRRLATLHQGNLDAGTHELTWHGVDSQGRELASGVYLVNLRTEAGSVTERAVLLR